MRARIVVALLVMLALAGVVFSAPPMPSPMSASPSGTTPVIVPPTETAKGATFKVEKDLDIEFVRVPPGAFIMGTSGGRMDHGRYITGGNHATSFDYYPDRPAHRVTFESGFLIGKYEVTNGQWEKVMRGVSCDFPPPLMGGPRAAVCPVSWLDAQRFVARLNELLPGSDFSLPTEEQWEYACRAGSTTKYSFGDDPAKLDEYAWRFGGEDPAAPRKPVGLKKPNAWGIYDMHGNASEWCLNAFTLYPGNMDRDPFLELFQSIGRCENETLVRRAKSLSSPRCTTLSLRADEGILERVLRGGPDVFRRIPRNEGPEEVYASARRAAAVGNLAYPGTGFRLVCHGFVELPAWRGVVSGTLPEKTAGVPVK